MTQKPPKTPESGHSLPSSEGKTSRQIDKQAKIGDSINIEVTTPLAGSSSHVPRGDSFFAEFLSPQQHLVLLKERGLSFKNHHEEERLERLIATIGYYRLSQYFRHFYTHPEDKHFREGTTGKQIITAYRQNERLRSVLIDALLKIESKLKTQLTEALIQHGQDIYWCYHPDYADLKLVEKATERNSRRYKAQSTYLFFKQYPNHTRLPAWVVMQSHEFGMLCKLMRHDNFPKQALLQTFKQFAIPVGIKSFHYIKMFDALRHLRNLCVHHEKLLGEHIRIAPPVWSGLDDKMAHRLDNILFWIEHLLKSITVRDSFANQLQEIMTTINASCPESMRILSYKPSQSSDSEIDD